MLSRIRRVARRLNAAALVSSSVGPVWAVVAGVALWRFTVQRWVPIAAAALAALGMIAVWVLLRPRLVTRGQAAVIADRQAGAGGLLLTRLEVDIGAWGPSLDALAERLVPPRVAIGRPLSALAIAFAFLGAALWIPLPAPAARPVQAAAAGRLETLERELEAVAKEEPVLPEMRNELDRLRDDIKQGTFDSADWEAADSLSKELERKAEEAGNELLKADQAAEKLAVAMDEGRTLEVLTRERDDLERALLDLSDGAAENGDQAFQQALDRMAPSSPPPGGLQAGEPPHEAPRDPVATQPGASSDRPSESSPASQTEARKAEARRKANQAGPQGSARPPETPPPASGERSASGSTGREGQGAPTRAELDELRRAIEKRREQLSKSFGQNDGQRAASSRHGSSPARKKSGAKKSGANGAQASGEQGAGEESASEEQGSGEGKASRVARELGGQHASRMMQGAPAHGPADDANLVFGGRAEMDPTRLKMKAAPEGNGGEGTELLGLVAADPTHRSGGKVAPGSGKGAVGEASPANRDGDYLPRNKALIQRYFDRPNPQARLKGGAESPTPEAR